MKVRIIKIFLETTGQVCLCSWGYLLINNILEKLINLTQLDKIHAENVYNMILHTDESESDIIEIRKRSCIWPYHTSWLHPVRWESDTRELTQQSCTCQTSWKIRIKEISHLSCTWLWLTSWSKCFLCQVTLFPMKG